MLDNSHHQVLLNAVTLSPNKIDDVITMAHSGCKPRWISKFRLPTHIFAGTPDERVFRRLRLLRGVSIIKQEQDLDSVHDIVKKSTNVAYNKGLVNKEKDIVSKSGVKMIHGQQM